MRLQPLVFFLVSASLFAQGAGDVLRNRITESAQKYLGVPYIYGAESPSAFDCSGFVHYVYKTVASLDLPRSSKQQWVAGMPIKLNEAQPGDVVVFDTTGAGGPSHVAIFLGDGRVIHAISEGPKTGVVISVLDKSSFGRMVLGYRLFLAPVAALSKEAQEAAAKAAREAQAAKAAQEAAVKAAREAAAKAEQETREAKAAQEAAARAAEEARAAKAVQEAAAQTAQESQAAQMAKVAEEAAAKAAREAREAQAAKAAQEAAAQAAQEAAAKATREAQTAKAAGEAAAQAAQAASPAPAKPAAAPPPSGPPIAQIGFDIPVEKVSFTDRIPAATGTGIAFTLRNATGKAGRFVVIFYKAEVDFSKSTEIHRELVDLPKDGALEIPPYVFKDAGTYKLIVKDNWNTQLLERIFKVIELKK